MCDPPPGGPNVPKQGGHVTVACGGLQGRYVFVTLLKTHRNHYLTLCEVKVQVGGEARPDGKGELEPQYLGCYKDNGSRDFKAGPKKYGYNGVGGPLKCHKACTNYKFFALQNNGWCSCDNSY